MKRAKFLTDDEVIEVMSSFEDKDVGLDPDAEAEDVVLLLIHCMESSGISPVRWKYIIQCCEFSGWKFHLSSRAIMNNLHKKGLVKKEGGVWWRLTDEGRKRLRSLGVRV